MSNIQSTEGSVNMGKNGSLTPATLKVINKGGRKIVTTVYSLCCLLHLITIMTVDTDSSSSQQLRNISHNGHSRFQLVFLFLFQVCNTLKSRTLLFLIIFLPPLFISFSVAGGRLPFCPKWPIKSLVLRL